MDVLIAHRGEAPRRGLAGALEELGCRLLEAQDGAQALALLVDTDAPQVALIEWELGGIQGPELCRLMRAARGAGPPYIILLARSDRCLAAGLDAGADDCVHMPVRADELRARVNVGRRSAALPWERVILEASGYAQRDPEREEYAAPVLEARCTPDDAGLDDARGTRRGDRCELASMLAAS